MRLRTRRAPGCQLKGPLSSFGPSLIRTFLRDRWPLFIAALCRIVLVQGDRLKIPAKLSDVNACAPTYDVFISYASPDRGIANAICARMESEGVRCWIAPRDVTPGADYSAEIIRRLEQCRQMVLVFSESANSSPHVKREVERAVSKEKVILPFRVEAVDPSKSLEFFISGTHWLDALTPPIELHIATLVEVTKRILSGGGTTRARQLDSASGPEAGSAIQPLVTHHEPFESQFLPAPRKLASVVRWVEISAWFELTQVSIGLAEDAQTEDIGPQLEACSHETVARGLMEMMSSLFVLGDAPLHIDLDPEFSWVCGTTPDDRFYANFNFGIDRSIDSLPRRDQRVRHLIVRTYPNRIWIDLKGDADDWGSPPLKELAIDWVGLCAGARAVASEFGLKCNLEIGKPIYRKHGNESASDSFKSNSILVTLN